MISINNIKKSYGEVEALKGISLEVKQGELFGLIGPDGAGKTSMLRILMSLILPDSGTALMNGFDIEKDYKEVRLLSGYMPGKFSLYTDLTVKENMEFFATVFGTTVKENYELVKDIYSQIEPFENRRAGKLSGGMKQKLALSCALIHKPKILILDEPTTGVDAVSRKEFWDMLTRLKEQNITILVSTPYMDEASLCDRIALIQDGEIFNVDTPERMKVDFKEDIWSLRCNTSLYQTSKILRGFPNTISINSFGSFLHIVTPKGKVKKEAIISYLEENGQTDIQLNSIKATIEDVFMLFKQAKS